MEDFDRSVLPRPLSARAPMFACVVARLMVGAVFLRAGLGKLEQGFGVNQGARKFIESSLAQGTPYKFFRGFLEHTVLPHVQLFSYLVMFGELMVGVCLLLGLLSRWASFVGLLIMLSIGATAGMGIEPASTLAFALLFFVIGATDAGRVAGLDGWLRKKPTAISD